jgi:hypothetical protein
VPGGSPESYLTSRTAYAPHSMTCQWDAKALHWRSRRLSNTQGLQLQPVTKAVLSAACDVTHQSLTLSVNFMLRHAGMRAGVRGQRDVCKAMHNITCLRSNAWRPKHGLPMLRSFAIITQRTCPWVHIWLCCRR